MSSRNASKLSSCSSRRVWRNEGIGLSSSGSMLTNGAKSSSGESQRGIAHFVELAIARSAKKLPQYIPRCLLLQRDVMSEATQRLMPGNCHDDPQWNPSFMQVSG